MNVTMTDLDNGRHTLLKTGSSIEQAADYCSSNYLCPKGNKRPIDETMAYATQSLGTMIHQINNLASSFLKILDTKTDNLTEVEAMVDKLSLEVKIRQEKIARKAIGSCTIPKPSIKYTHSKIRQEMPHEYVRRAIDYSILDHIGHGTKTQDPVPNQYGMPNTHTQTMSRRGSMSSHPVQSNIIDSNTVAGKHRSEYAAALPLPHTGHYQSGTLGRTAGIYRPSVITSQNLTSATSYINPQNQFIHPNELGVQSQHNLPLSVIGGSNSLGHSRRSSSSSGAHHLYNQRNTPCIQLPSGLQQTLPKGSGQTAQRKMSEDNNMYQFKSPNHQISGGMKCKSSEQSAYLPNLNLPHAQLPTNTQMHHYPNQYQNAQNAFSTSNLNSEIKNLSIVDMPPPPILMKPKSNILPEIDLELQKAAIDQLDDAVAMPLPPVSLNAQTQPSLIDISRLQPSPMDQLRTRQSDDPLWAPRNFIQKVLTVYEYTADKNDELTFGENELIYVIKKNDDGWWEGVMNGNTGLFPGNYVDVID